MNENLKTVLEKLGKDKALQEKMSQCKSPEEAYELAKTIGDGFTLEEFSETMLKVKEAASGAEEGEITDADLQNVAGGLSDDALIGIGVAGVALPCAAAAAFS